MKKPIFLISLLVFFGCGVLYAQPRAVGEPRVIAKTDEPFERPVWSADGKTLYFNSMVSGERWEVASTGKRLKRASAKATVQRQSLNANLLFEQFIAEPAEVAAKVEGLQSLSDCILFNPVLSPTGDYIVFQASYGKGLFVCNADGSGLRSLGNGSRATWTKDGKFVVAAITEDDGHSINRGKLVSIDAANGTRSDLFDSDKYIAMSPAISPDGNKLAFEEYGSGAIYVIDIQ